MNHLAQTAMNLGNARYTNLNVGDLVIAPLRDGSEMVTARVHSFNDTHVFFLWRNVVFSVSIELAADCTLLLERYNREALIAEIMNLMGKVA